MANERFDNVWDALEKDPVERERMKLLAQLMMTLQHHIREQGWTPGGGGSTSRGLPASNIRPDAREDIPVQHRCRNRTADGGGCKGGVEDATRGLNQRGPQLG